MCETDKYSLTVHHPTEDSRSWEMLPEGSHTPDDLVQALIEEGYLARTVSGYAMATKGGNLLRLDQSLAAQKIPHDAHLRIIPLTKCC
jgi:hypothetical protein